jgi:PITH domain
VVNIVFKGEVRVKSICICGAPEGMAPSRVYLYRNESVVDADIMNDKKPIQQIELAENITGEAEYPVN